ncbi:protein FIZZY-RELATED 1 [Selaginella moellendorffii]|uniref:protein FIZZY-RELATED 1 n=1 Tax=Selaginella moellendorffii TaxID=88036 RepID=UPI000D1C4F2F|nr:protein FIZZY-RELATED 1 [Selaginella moellendorffii]|eukprot:XP_024527053.1 protein FIZZY-RELATED 1 [Selaginella moellendorffii]
MESVENAAVQPDRSRSRTRLNLPAGMAAERLRVEISRAVSVLNPAVAGGGGGGSTPSPTRMSYSDRFIPSRSSSNLAGFALLDNSPSLGSDASKEEGVAVYSMLLRSELLGGDAGPLSPGTPDKNSLVSAGVRDSTKSPLSPSRNLLRFKSDSRAAGAPCHKSESLSPGALDFGTTGASSSPVKLQRKVSRVPFKVLDAPALQDDFYLNLVDWSAHNVLAVGLGNCVYLWSASTSKVTKLCDLGHDDAVCSVAWTHRGTYLAVGSNAGEVQIWDAIRCKKVRTMEGHRTRVGTLAWNSVTLSSGSRDRNILNHDVRVPEDYTSKLCGHKSEVCGLKWSFDDRELASGGNDNQLFVWNQLSTQPVCKFSEHTAAVKAIAWSPHQHGLLTSGGGTADRCIRFWNTSTNSHINCVDTGGQVCNLMWSKNVNELVSTHGYSQNQIIVWRYPTMTKLTTLTGHTYRVLYLSMSPDGQTIVTGAGDETLRFWNVFPSPKSQNAVRDSGMWSLGRTHIR